jgi:hypothetical protein
MQNRKRALAQICLATCGACLPTAFITLYLILNPSPKGEGLSFYYFLLVQKVTKKDPTPHQVRGRLKTQKFATRRAPALIWRLKF